MRRNSLAGFHLSLLLLAIVLTPQVWAQGASPSNAQSQPSDPNEVVDEEIDEMLDMELEDLLVYVASKKEERIQDAPGIITVITSQDIKLFGAQNLRDILNRQTSIQIVGDSLLPHNRVSMRGVNLCGDDNKVLLLMNGRPIREEGLNGQNLDLYSFFPLEIINHLEIIRGPGSVIYGTNAFSGVINIVTKKPSNFPGMKLSSSYGSYGRKKIEVSGGEEFEGISFYGSLNYIESDGDDFDNITDGNGIVDTYRTGEQGIQGAFQASWKNFTLNTILSDSSKESARSLFNFPSADVKIDRQFVDLGYSQEITDRWDITGNFTYNSTQNLFFQTSAQSSATKRSPTNYLFSLTTHGQITDALNVLMGGNYNTTKDSTLDEGLWRANYFIQFDYQMLDWLKFVGGFQLNKPQNTDLAISPRFGLIGSFNENAGFKLLYGEAYRAPSLINLFLDGTGLKGDSNLKSEIVKTFDAQVFYNASDYQGALTFFTSEYSDIITTKDVGGVLTFANEGEITFFGVELEGKARIANHLDLIGNLTWQTNQDEAGRTNVTFAPNWMVKSGIIYYS